MDSRPPMHDLLNPVEEPVLKSSKAQTEDATNSPRLHYQEAIAPYSSGWESSTEASIVSSTTTGKKRRLDSLDEDKNEIFPSKRRDMVEALQTGETDSDGNEVFVPKLLEPEFPQFSKVPIEIRLKIWRFMIPGSRVVIVDFFHKKISDNWDKDNNQLLTLVDDSRQAKVEILLGTRSATPIIFSICRESRIEAQRIFFKGFSTADHPLRPLRWQPEEDIIYFVDDEIRDCQAEDEHLNVRFGHLHGRSVFRDLLHSISEPTLQNLRYLALDLGNCTFGYLAGQLQYLDPAARGMDEGSDLNLPLAYFISKFPALKTLYFILDPFGHALREGEPSFLAIEDVQPFEFDGTASDDFEEMVGSDFFINRLVPDRTPQLVVKIKVLTRSKESKVPFCFGRRWCRDDQEFLSPKRVKSPDRNENRN